MVQVVGIRCSLDTLRQMVLPPALMNGSTGDSWYGARIPDEPHLQFSELERLALSQSLQAVPIYWLARCRAVSTKTIYTQRTHALLKLGVTHVRELLGYGLDGMRQSQVTVFLKGENGDE
ncbi:hypothetical protein DYG65_21810 [Yersinia enterocolitica]|nr:hypothetical protein [Yersinia enterocolitica]